MKKKNIVFDLGWVLLEFDWKTYLKSYGYDEKTYGILSDAVFLNSDWNVGDTGLVDERGWEEILIENAPEYREDIHKIFSNLERTIRPMPYAEELIACCRRKGYRLYFLSNYSEKLHRETKRQMKFLENFDGGIFSYQVKCMKPGARIYKILIERYGIDPKETIFFDDREENVAAARRLGMEGVVFSPGTAYKILEREEILSL